MTHPELAARIRQIRTELGNPSQRLAANLFDVSEATWQRMEAGEGYPKGDTLAALGREGFSPTWVLLGIGPMRLDRAGPAPRPNAILDAECEPAVGSQNTHAADFRAVVSRMLERHVDFDMLDAAFRDALSRAQIPEAAVKDPHMLMMLTVAIYDVRVLEEAARNRPAPSEAEVKSERDEATGD